MVSSRIVNSEHLEPIRIRRQKPRRMLVNSEALGLIVGAAGHSICWLPFGIIVDLPDYCNVEGKRCSLHNISTVFRARRTVVTNAVSRWTPSEYHQQDQYRQMRQAAGSDYCYENHSCRKRLCRCAHRCSRFGS